MKTILLLGGFGFIGTNILKYLDSFQINTYKVIVFDKSKSHPHNLQFNSIERTYNGNFSNVYDIEQIFKENKIDVVLHSLSTTVPAISSDIYYDINSNLVATIQLLELMVKYQVGNIIYISSGGAVYGDTCTNKKWNEYDATYPISSYGIIKLIIEKYLYQYSYLYDIKSLVLRLSNPYGKYHYSMKQGIINIALRDALFSMPLSVWGDGCAEKDFIYVEDFCDILFKIVDLHYTYLLVNIGSGQILSVNTILESIKKLIPSFKWTYTKKSLTDINRFELDTTKLYSLIGDYNFTPFLIGLEKVIQWLEYPK
jgi:UDP-glucose 4-epimerase